MTSSIRNIASSAFSRPRALRGLSVIIALTVSVGVQPGAADARVRPRGAYAGTYDGIWNVVFATTRGTCSSGYSVPFTVNGGRVSSAGGGRVAGTVGRGGSVAVNVSVGASRASGSGRLARNNGAGSSPATPAAVSGTPRGASPSRSF